MSFFPFFLFLTSLSSLSLLWARVICCFRFSLSHCRWLADRLLIRFSPLMCYSSICGLSNRLFLRRIMHKKHTKTRKQQHLCAQRTTIELLSKNPFENLMVNFLFVRLSRWIGAPTNAGLQNIKINVFIWVFGLFFLEIHFPFFFFFFGIQTLSRRSKCGKHIHRTQMLITHITAYAIFLYLLQV